MLKGVTMRVAAALAFAIMATFAKLTYGGYSVGQIVFFRSAFALTVLVVWLRARGEFPRALYTRRPLGHLARGTGGTGGMFSYFLAVALLPLPDVTAIGYLAPLLVVALAAVFLGETVRFYRWSAVVIGFAGIIVMVGEHLGEGSTSQTGAIAALASAAFAAYAVIQTRRLATSESTGAIVFYFSLLTSAFAFLLMTAGYVWPEAAPLGPVRRHRPDPDDRVRALRRRLGDRALRIYLDGLGGSARLRRIRGQADHAHSGRLDHRDFGWDVRAVARAQARAYQGPPTRRKRQPPGLRRNSFVIPNKIGYYPGRLERADHHGR